jgi:TolB protein
MKLRTFLTTLTLAFSSALFAADTPYIGTIVKPGQENKLVPLSIAGYSGEVDQVLRFDLSISGFELVSESAAQLILKGSNSGQVEGRLNDKSGNNIFAKAYSGGSARSQAHALADDIVQLIFKTPGVGRTKLVFKQDRGQSAEIYVSDFDGFNPIAVTSDNARVISPSWGPGRQMLYYTSYRSKYADIYSHNLTSGERRAVAEYPGSNLSPAISRDGRKLAMILSKGGSPDLYVADADGKNLRQITKTPDDESSPTWSPDGTRICYSAREAKALFVISATGGTPRRLNFATGGIPSEPDWSPDGKSIIFTVYRGGKFELLVGPADGNGSVTPLGEGEDPSWAPNSRTVAFVRRDGNRRVLSLLDVPSKTVKSIPLSLGNCSQPCWSR